MDEILTNLETSFAVNLGVKRKVVNGVEYAIVPVVSLVPGVLNGSDGPGYYSLEETAKSTPLWNEMPLTVYHPYDPVTGKPLSAGHPGVIERQGIGKIRNSTFNNKLRHEAWIDLDKAKKVDKRVYESVLNGTPLEVSTGLFMQKVSIESTHNGKPYVWAAKNYRPDHLAILPDQRGACSMQDGCGLHINRANPIKGGVGDETEPQDVDGDELAAGIKVEMEHTRDPKKAQDIALDHLTEDPKYYTKLRASSVEHNASKSQPSDHADVSPDKACQILKDGTAQGHDLTDKQRGMFGAICGQRVTKNELGFAPNFDEPVSDLVDNLWTDRAREAAAIAHHIKATSDKSTADKTASAIQTGNQPAGASGGKGGAGKAGAQNPQAATQAAHQASMTAAARGIASQNDLLHVEYAHVIAAYQFELAAMAHAQQGDQAAYDAHKKAADAHRKTAEAIRKKIEHQDSKTTGGASKSSDKDKKPARNEEHPLIENALSHDEIREQLHRAFKERNMQNGDPGYPYVHTVYDGHCVYENRGKHYMQKYSTRETKDGRGVVTLKNEPPVEVQRKVDYLPTGNSVVTYSPVAGSSTSSESTMSMTKEQRDAAIATLTANCSCDKDKAAFNSLSDDAIQMLTKNAKAVGSNADVKDDPATAAAMKRKQGIEDEHNDPGNPKKPATQTNDNQVRRNQAAPSMDEWMASAPPEVQAVVNAAMKNLSTEKTQIIERLVANLGNDAAKEAARKAYAKMSNDELKVIAGTQTVPAMNLGAYAQLLGGGANYMGAGAPLVGSNQRVDNSADEDILPLPTMNMDDDGDEDDDEEDDKPKKKKKRA